VLSVIHVLELPNPLMCEYALVLHIDHYDILLGDYRLHIFCITYVHTYRYIVLLDVIVICLRILIQYFTAT
jgi:hypothetical protein